MGCMLVTNEMHNSYNQSLFNCFLSALHVSNESSRSSSGVRHNIRYYTVQSVQSCCQASLAASTQLDFPDSTIVPIVPNCVIQYIMPCS